MAYYDHECPPDLRDTTAYKAAAVKVKSLIKTGEYITDREIQRRLAKARFTVRGTWYAEILSSLYLRNEYEYTNHYGITPVNPAIKDIPTGGRAAYIAPKRLIPHFE